MGSTLIDGPRQRAAAILTCGSLSAAVEGGAIPRRVSVSVAEGIVLGLLKQGVCKYLAVFGHGSTAIGDCLRIYEAVGVIRTYAFHNEIAMAHAATALRWQYGETSALVASIGPGALQAMAGSLTAITNAVGVYHIYGDQTTYGEGQNLQQIPKTEQAIFSRVTSLIGESYLLHTPEALRDLMRRASGRVNHPFQPGPFFIHLPMNVQPELIQNLNLSALPEKSHALLGPPNPTALQQAALLVRNHKRIVIKAGGGARRYGPQIQRLAEVIGAVVVTSPNSQGLLPEDHPANLHLGGGKGSLSGNFAMGNAELVIVMGSRGVCQADCSGVGYTKAEAIININASVDDALHYNKTVALIADIGLAADSLSSALANETLPGDPVRVAWLELCRAKKLEWRNFKANHYRAATRHDERWQRPVLTQAAALKAIVDFANAHRLSKLFDAGDVQSNAMQVCEDPDVNSTFTDGGASYMGFAVSGLVASAIADSPRYTIAVTGDGSFWMSPQVLLNAIEHKLKGAIVLLDNRRMGAISTLQAVQYGEVYKTSDDVAVDYRTLANAFRGINALSGGFSSESLTQALEDALEYPGMSLIHVPIYWTDGGESNLGSFGRWNVGSWCAEVQADYLSQEI